MLDFDNLTEEAIRDSTAEEKLKLIDECKRKYVRTIKYLKVEERKEAVLKFNSFLEEIMMEFDMYIDYLPLEEALPFAGYELPSLATRAAALHHN